MGMGPIERVDEGSRLNRGDVFSRNGSASSWKKCMFAVEVPCQNECMNAEQILVGFELQNECR